jgi:hypothetical protein
LANLNKKVIVVVDDLDRLGFSAIKDVLFAIKKSFTLPNVSYVLCYDTENLIPADENVDKIMEFLEKFINVKIGLYLDAETLRRFVTESAGEYRNAKEYEEYLGTLPPGAQFLVSETFTASRRLKETRIDRASEIEQRTYACFNGGLFGGGR